MITTFLKTLYGLGREWPTGESDYWQLLWQIEEHSISATVYTLLKQSGRLSETPPFFRERLVERYEASFLQNLLIKTETARLLDLFEAKGIEVIPLKGTVLAERYFGHFAARSTSDIDLLTKPERMADAVRLVQEAGFSRPEESSPVHYHTEWCKDAPGHPEPVTVELHWSFVQQGIASIDVEAIWREAERLEGTQHVRLLSPEATFYTLCLHGASHMMESAKHVLDLLHMLREHGEYIRLDGVLQRAARDRTLNRVKAALSVLYHLFPELMKQHPLPEPMPLRGWPGFGGENGAFRQYGYSLRMLDTPRDKAVHLLRLLFPSRRLAAYSIGEHGEGVVGTYFRLYRQRLRKLFGG